MTVKLMGSRLVIGPGNAQVTPLMAFLAGQFAEQMARIWPAPHEGFFMLPAARRHAAGVIVSGAAVQGDHEPGRLRNRLLHARDSEIAREIAGDKASGLLRLLGKMGEQLWSPGDYRQLIDLFRDEQANLALRHMQAVTPQSFAPIQILPSVLRQAKILMHVHNTQAAQDLALAFQLSVRLKGQAQMSRIAARWARAETRERLFDMARTDLCPDAFTANIPVPVLPAPFVAVRARRALEAVALEFENCLRSFREDIARGRLAVFAWRGETPATLALSRDLDGWRLAEAEAAKNEELDEAVLRQIVPALHAVGVRTGPSFNVVSNRLDCHSRGETVHANGDTFIDRLELGDLWS